jgi:hypothetical protein
MGYSENYNIDPVALVEGQIVDTSPAVIVSRTAAAAVGFGKMVRGSGEHIVTPDVSAATLDQVNAGGITVLSQATGARAVNPDTYPIGDTIAVMRQGVIAVKVTDVGGVVAGDPVWLKKSDGTFSNADVGSSGGIRLPGCRWESAGANGAIARMRVNFDVPAVAGA